MGMYKWIIWYPDNIISGSTEEEWNNAPYDDVQAVVEFFGYDRYGRKLQSVHRGTDWYWFYNGTVTDSARTHMEKDKWVECTAPVGAHVKRGKYTEDHIIARIEKEVSEFITSGKLP